MKRGTLSWTMWANIFEIVNYFWRRSPKQRAPWRRTKQPTLHLALLHFAKLERILREQVEPSKATEMVKLKQRAHYVRKTKVIPTMENKITIFCPQFRHLRMVSAEERDEVYERVRRRIASSPRELSGTLQGQPATKTARATKQF